MQEFKDFEFISTLLKEGHFGLWIIEAEKGKPERFYLNTQALKILGFENKKASPQELFKEWYERISPATQDLVKSARKKMKGGDFSEIQIIWNHPKKGEITLWLGGMRECEKQGVRYYKGMIRNVSEKKSIVNGFTFFGIAQALCRDFESVYYVNIKTGKYKEYIGHGNFKEFRFQTEGSDFFKESIANIPSAVYIADQKRVIDFISEENIKPAIKARKTISIRYRIVVEGKPLFYRLTAAPSVPEDKNHYIFGVQNIEENVKVEKEYSEKIRLATEMANTDALTGIKNRLAYEKAEEHLNDEINAGTISPFSVGVFDLNNLKKTNDKYGHEAGDELIRSAAHLICTTFTHSPVYRIGGDEFAVILLGADYFDREKIFAKFQKSITHNRKNGMVVVASGYADFVFGHDTCVGDVFEHADEHMYENKKKLKKK